MDTCIMMDVYGPKCPERKGSCYYAKLSNIHTHSLMHDMYFIKPEPQDLDSCLGGGHQETTISQNRPVHAWNRPLTSWHGSRLCGAPTNLSTVLLCHSGHQEQHRWVNHEIALIPGSWVASKSYNHTVGDCQPATLFEWRYTFKCDSVSTIGVFSINKVCMWCRTKSYY